MKNATLDECRAKGYQDGRYGGFDHAFHDVLSKRKREAYSAGYQSGQKNPIRC